MTTDGSNPTPDASTPTRDGAERRGPRLPGSRGRGMLPDRLVDCPIDRPTDCPEDYPAAYPKRSRRLPDRREIAGDPVLYAAYALGREEGRGEGVLSPDQRPDPGTGERIAYDRGARHGWEDGFHAAFEMLGLDADRIDWRSRLGADYLADLGRRWKAEAEQGNRIDPHPRTGPAKTAAQIRAEAAWSWRQVEREITERENARDHNAGPGAAQHGTGARSGATARGADARTGAAQARATGQDTARDSHQAHRAAGHQPRAAGNEARAGGNEARAGGNEARAGGNEARAAGNEPVAGARAVPRARSTTTENHTRSRSVTESTSSTSDSTTSTTTGRAERGGLRPGAARDRHAGRARDRARGVEQEWQL